jgi:hypothetical protein
LVVASGARHALDEITFTDDACEGLTQVPKMFRKMALKTIMKSAIAILAFLLSGWVVQRYTISFPS